MTETNQTALDAIRASSRHLGALRTLRRVASRALRRWTGIDVLQCLVMTRETIAVARLPGYRYRVLDADEIRRLAEDPDQRLARRFVEEALSSGWHCCAAFDGEEVASYGWYSLTTTRTKGDFHLAFDDQCAYGMNSYTRPRYRGRGISGSLAALILDEVEARGRRAVVGIVDPSHRASVRNSTKTGYRPCGRIFTIGLGRWRRYLHTPGCAEFGMRIGRLETLRG